MKQHFQSKYCESTSFAGGLGKVAAGLRRRAGVAGWQCHGRLCTGCYDASAVAATVYCILYRLELWYILQYRLE